MSDNYELNSLRKDINNTKKLIKEKQQELEKASDDDQFKYQAEIHRLKLQLNLQRKRYIQLRDQKPINVQEESLLNIFINNPPF